MYPSPYQAMQPFNNVVEVAGIDGARAFPMGPNSRAILLDTVEPVAYLKSTDANGFPTIDVCDVVKREPEPEPAGEYATRDDLARIEAKLDELLGAKDEPSVQQPASTDEPAAGNSGAGKARGGRKPANASRQSRQG